jgi:aflatoxin B1 aldehyde reductase
MPAKLICGDINALDPSALKVALQNAGIVRMDTAARYRNGESERTIGRAKLPETFAIDTKILYQIDGTAQLSTEAIEKSLSNSLNVLGVDKVNVLYCHAPDYQTPIEVQAKAFDEQYRRGRFAQVYTLI